MGSRFRRRRNGRDGFRRVVLATAPRQPGAQYRAATISARDSGGTERGDLSQGLPYLSYGTLCFDAAALL